MANEMFKEIISEAARLKTLILYWSIVGIKTGGQFSIPTPKKGSTKKCSNYQTIVFTSHASKVMLKNLQARLQQYLN